VVAGGWFLNKWFNECRQFESQIDQQFIITAALVKGNGFRLSFLLFAKRSEEEIA